MKNSSKVLILSLTVMLFFFYGFSQKKKIPPKGKPYKNLTKQKDGHWTAYKTPSFPAGSQIHIVKKGDTLWDIAAQYLHNAYLWPQIWEKNQYIQNPHWIYPGDPILIEKPKLVEKPKKVEQSKEITVPEKEEKPVKEKKIKKLHTTLKPNKAYHKPLNLVVNEINTYYGTEKELYGTGQISSTPLKFDTFIVGAEEESSRRYFGNGDIVYINKGMRQNVYPGSKFEVFRSSGLIKNPLTKKKVGYYYRELGIVKVLISHKDNAICGVDYSAGAIYIGDGLLPYKEKVKVKRDKNHKFERFLQDNGKPSGNIVFIEDKRTVASAGNIVYIDLGKNANVKPGQFCSIYRIEGKYKKESEFYPNFPTPSYREKEDPSFKSSRLDAVAHRSLPRIIVGDLVVIEVFDNTAKATVVTAKQFLELGDFIQLQ